MNCEHCAKVFKTKSSLNHHKNKAKYCLDIQKKNKEIHDEKSRGRKFICKFCNKILSSKRNLDSHFNCCSEKKDKEQEINEMNKRIEKELRELKELNDLKDKGLVEKDKIIVRINTQLERQEEQLEKQEEQIRDLQDKLDRIANKAIDRPTTTVTNTTTNNNLNITTSMDFDNMETLKDAIETKLNANYIVDGQRGLAQFLVDTILKDSDGNLKYKCTDSSRGIYKFLNNDGEIRKDVDAKKLISYIVNGGIKGKSVEIANRWYTDEDGGIDMMKYGIMNEPQQNILKIEDDNSSFRRELASMTSV